MTWPARAALDGVCTGYDPVPHDLRGVAMLAMGPEVWLRGGGARWRPLLARVCSDAEVP